jgi:acyl-CoA thioester hydrolase
VRKSLGEPEGLVHRMALRVRWAECDAAGIVYHPRVLDWFSEARVAWLEAAGASYYNDVRAEHVELLVLDLAVQFVRALRPGDAVQVDVWADELTAARMRFCYRVEHQGRVAVEGFTRHAFVRDGRAVNLSRAAPALFARLERTAAPAPGRRPSASGV